PGPLQRIPMAEPSAQPTPRRRLRLVAAGALALTAVTVWVACRRPSRPAPTPPAEEASFPPPPLSPSPHRNTTADARYLGSQSCSRCHPDETASYRETGMGRSMAVVRADRAPPDGAVDHPPSGRRYRIDRRDGRLHHRELLRTPGPEEV